MAPKMPEYNDNSFFTIDRSKLDEYFRNKLGISEGKKKNSDQKTITDLLRRKAPRNENSGVQGLNPLNNRGS